MKAQQPESELSSDEFRNLREKYGLPFEYNKEGEISKINQCFFAALYCQKNRLVFDPEERTFYYYDQSTGLWRKQTEEEQHCDLPALIMQYVPNGYIRHSSSGVTSQIQKFIKGIAQKSGVFTHKRKNTIHVANGILEFAPDQGWQLRPPSPEDYSRNRSEIVYAPEAQCSLFINQLLEKAMCQDDIDQLQLYAGQILLGYNLTQRFLLLTGTAGGGKSTLVNILEGIIGRRNCCELRTEHLDQRFEIARFVGKTLLTAKDVKSRFLDTPGAVKIKALTGKDTLTADFKGVSAGVDVVGCFNIIITSNSMLRVAFDGDIKAWRRRLLWVKYEFPPTDHPIVDLDEKILKEEGSGVLNWALEGARKLLEHDGQMQLSETQENRINDLLLESDVVEQFVRSYVVQANGFNVTSEEMWRAFVSFCDEQDYKAGAKRLFLSDLKDKMSTLFRLNQSHRIRRYTTLLRGYDGVRLQRRVDRILDLPSPNDMPNAV